MKKNILKSINNIQSNIVSSFSNVKKDIDRLSNHDILIKNELNDIHFRLEKIEETQRSLLEVLTKFQESEISFIKEEPVLLVGVKNTKELHREDCLLAKLDGKQKRIIFDNKTIALNSGFKECVCLQ